MNRKVFVSMLALCVSFLAGCYFLKIFFPQEFVMAISNEKIVAIGNYIDSHQWLYYLCCGLTAFVTYYLYCGACSERLLLKWYEILEIIGVIVLVRVVSLFDNNVATGIQFASFMFLPYQMKGKFRNAAIVYTTHCLSQNLSLSIRNLPMYLTKTNFATMFVFGIESYLWLSLFFVIYNYKAKEI